MGGQVPGGVLLDVFQYGVQNNLGDWCQQQIKTPDPAPPTLSERSLGVVKLSLKWVEILRLYFFICVCVP